jgi:hypothetical protein
MLFSACGVAGGAKPGADAAPPNAPVALGESFVAAASVLATEELGSALKAAAELLDFSSVGGSNAMRATSRSPVLDNPVRVRDAKAPLLVIVARACSLLLES